MGPHYTKSIPVIMCSIWHLQKAELASRGRCWSFSPCLFCLVYTSLSSWKSQTGITKPSATQLTDQPCFDESAFWLYGYSSSWGFPLIPLWYLIVLLLEIGIYILFTHWDNCLKSLLSNKCFVDVDLISKWLPSKKSFSL